MNVNCLNKMLSCYKKLRNAPDTIMIRKDFNIYFSVFRRDKPEAPIWSVSNSGNTIEFSVIDAVFIISAVTAVITLMMSFSCIYRKLRFAKRW